MNPEFALTFLEESDFDLATDCNRTRYRFFTGNEWISSYLPGRAISMPIDTYITNVIPSIRNSLLIYEVHVTEGPYWWSGFNSGYIDNLPHKNVVEMLPDLVKERVRNRTGFVHYDQSLEGFPLYDYYEYFYDEFNRFNLPPSQFILSTSNLIEKELHDKYCIENDITDKMIIVSCNFFATHVANIRYFDEPVEQITSVQHLAHKHNKEISTFNCLNRIVRSHRVALVTMMNYYNLLEGNKVSHSKITSDVQNKSIITRFKLHPAFNDDNMQDTIDKLPLVVDTDDFTVNKAQNFLRDMYMNSWVSVITETHYCEFHGTSMFFSEKIFKPILANHPFIIVGAPGSLKMLREQGFKTFSDYWDESYDDIEDDTYRLEAICELLIQLSKKSHSEWMTIYRNMLPLLEHNYRRLKNTNWLYNLHVTIDKITPIPVKI